MNDCLEDCGFCVLNGRSIPDAVGAFTIIGKNGCSVIDYVWININCIEFFADFSVFDETSSDHLPICCHLSIPLPEVNALDRDTVVRDNKVEKI